MSRAWDPTKWDSDAQKYGSAGLIWNGGRDPRGLTDGRSGNGWNFDPRYVQQDQYAGSEGNGGQNFYQPTDHLNGLLGGKVQVRDINRLKDRNAVTDGGSEVGWLTDPSNYTDDTDWVDKAFHYGGMALVGGIPAMHALTAGGLLGGGAQGGGFNAAGTGMSGGPGYGASLEGISSAGGVSGHSLGGGLASANPFAAAGAGSEALQTGGDLPHGTEIPNTYGAGVDPSPLGMTPGGAAGTAGGLLSGGLEGLLGGLIKNPMQALGLLGIARGALGGGSTAAPSGGSSGPFQALPKGNRGEWTPNAHTAAQLQNFKWAGR